ncbi:DUF3489 domain-containing protein [Bauldia litoralis]|uniref:DUF3489 domain-containing protein n=1 Tax=Bauldia litoralis TaxID=665467 RepID=A0A1G6EJR6_9HYPH|nr:DUF3489 domain-containing protein [Bauldia litoralis]SDB57614.1 Protein of unknown function [Bauldia litoralis]
MTRLSDSQLVVLTAACERPDRSVYPITARLKGIAAGNVLKSLLAKGLISEVRAKRDDTIWRHDEKQGRLTLQATPAAFAALGIDESDEPAAVEAETPQTESRAKRARTAKAARVNNDKPARIREGTKQAMLIDLLKRPTGATITEIVEATSWQPHTVRGAIAGALKKKLGLAVTSEKLEGRGRVYRI